MKSKLDNGKIPAHTVCPFRDQCGFVEAGTCHHKGTEHTVQFSCGAARAYDIIMIHERRDIRDADKYQEMIGKRVVKKSRKPFKSGHIINTIKGVTTNPYANNRAAFTFEEDESFVNCQLCKLYQPETN